MCRKTVWKLLRNYTNSRTADAGTMLQYACYISMKWNTFTPYHLGIILKNGLLKSVPNFLLILLCLKWATLHSWTLQVSSSGKGVESLMKPHGNVTMSFPLSLSLDGVLSISSRCRQLPLLSYKTHWIEQNLSYFSVEKKTRRQPGTRT